MHTFALVSIGGRAWLDFRQGLALMHRHMVGRVARDLVLRIIKTAAASVAFVFHVFRMNFRDGAVHMAGLGVPAHVIVD